MKRLFFAMLTCAAGIVEAQNGLEQILVEKYYVTEPNDTIANAIGGVLPLQSVTYRVYADMLPGYKFQAAFGIPNHELRLETTTLFFNNEDRGAVFPTFTKNQSRLNTVMLDSWLSVGAACAGHFGIAKSEDDGVNTNINNFTPQVLQGADPSCGIPISVEDGLISIPGRTPESVTPVGIDTILAMFNNQNDGTNGPVFSTFNGSWASLNGSVGPDSALNQVLICQITTDGVFSFKLNIQIGTPTGGFEQYVAENPTGNEIQIPSLIYNSSLVTADYTVRPTLQADKIRLHPNPAGEQLVFRLPVRKNEVSTSASQMSEAQVEVYSYTGTLISRNALSKLTQSDGGFILPTMELQAGSYILRVNGADGSESARFVKL